MNLIEPAIILILITGTSSIRFQESSDYIGTTICYHRAGHSNGDEEVKVGIGADFAEKI
jgi:hypothetical protein